MTYGINSYHISTHGVADILLNFSDKQSGILCKQLFAFKKKIVKFKNAIVSNIAVKNYLLDIYLNIFKMHDTFDQLHTVFFSIYIKQKLYFFPSVNGKV